MSGQLIHPRWNRSHAQSIHKLFAEMAAISREQVVRLAVPFLLELGQDLLHSMRRQRRHAEQDAFPERVCCVLPRLTCVHLLADGVSAGSFRLLLCTRLPSNAWRRFKALKARHVHVLRFHFGRIHRTIPRRRRRWRHGRRLRGPLRERWSSRAPRRPSSCSKPRS